eukprot:TRINITY_DN1203_c0_g1_i1.p1 TRINITY_DN1203_c0_g1~~TRINITY_DN1203_c0_g1_i1.p1  ORF type:complete len:181 (-),score=65.54 TRINITY_DN1203_c0_g1_i1:69-611(-)
MAMQATKLFLFKTNNISKFSNLNSNLFKNKILLNSNQIWNNKNYEIEKLTNKRYYASWTNKKKTEEPQDEEDSTQKDNFQIKDFDKVCELFGPPIPPKKSKERLINDYEASKKFSILINKNNDKIYRNMEQKEFLQIAALAALPRELRLAAMVVDETALIYRYTPTETPPVSGFTDLFRD